MKKLLSYAVLALVSASVLVGCKPKEPEPTVPPTTPTNTTPANP